MQPALLPTFVSLNKLPEMKKDLMTNGSNGTYLIATPAISLPLLVTGQKKLWKKPGNSGKVKQLPLHSVCGSDSCIEDF